MRALLPFLVTGVVTGSLYGLAALGLVLTYRTSGTFNFGHGAVGAAAAFLFYTLRITYGVPWPIAAVVVIVLFATVVGFVLERLTRTLRDVPQAVDVVATVGILLGAQGLLYLTYGLSSRTFPEFLPTSGFTFSGVNVSWGQVIAIAIATGCSVGLYVFLRRSRLGVAMRAVVDNPTLVSLTGERPLRVRRAAWSIGSAFAALSGILLAPTLGLDAVLLTLLVIQAFGAAAIGLFSNLPATYLGGILVGTGASVATKYFTAPPFNGLPPSVPFLILVVVLLAVPIARFPQRRASLRSLVTETTPISSRTGAALVLIGGAGLLVIPTVVGTKLPLWISALSYVVIFGSLALLVWTSGQLSLCHAAFVAFGATTFSHLTDARVPWAIALLLAGLLTVPIGALVAIPAIRLSGIYLALATLGFGILMQNAIYPTFFMFGAELTVTGAPRPDFGFIDGSDRSLYYIVLAVAAVTLVVLTGVYRSRPGRLLRALSESPTMLATHGLEVNMVRLAVFCLSAFFAGIGGALLLAQTTAASGVTYGPITSLMLLAVLAICGTRLLRSSILAATLFAIVPGYVTGFTTDRQIFTFGAAAIASALLVAKRPDFAAWVRRAASSSDDRVRRDPVRSSRPRFAPRSTPMDDGTTIEVALSRGQR